MIGRIAGNIILSQPPQLMIDCNGVGYEIEAPLSVFFDLPPVGKPVVLFTHLTIRDDAHLLFGFKSIAQRTMFRELIKVSGVGPKVAIGILSGLSIEEFSACGSSTSGGSNQSQAIAALEALGFKNTEARKMVKDVSGETVEDIIREALKKVSGS